MLPLLAPTPSPAMSAVQVLLSSNPQSISHPFSPSRSVPHPEGRDWIGDKSEQWEQLEDKDASAEAPHPDLTTTTPLLSVHQPLPPTPRALAAHLSLLKASSNPGCPSLALMLHCQGSWSPGSGWGIAREGLGEPGCRTVGGGGEEAGLGPRDQLGNEPGKQPGG